MRKNMVFIFAKNLDTDKSCNLKSFVHFQTRLGYFNPKNDATLVQNIETPLLSCLVQGMAKTFIEKTCVIQQEVL